VVEDGGGGFSMSIAVALREERATIVAMMMHNFILVRRGS